MRSIKTIFKFLSLKFQAHMAFRTDVVFEILTGIFISAFTFIFFEVIYSYVETIGGFDKGKIYILTGTVYLMANLYRTFFGSGIFTLSTLVRYGRLEKYLIRPLDPKILVALREPRFDTLYRLPSYFALFIYGFYLTKTLPSITNFLLYIISLIISFFIYLFLHYNLTLLTFWIIEVYNLYYIIYDLYEFSKYPEKIYKGLFRTFFITIIPVIILSNYPVKFLFGEGKAEYLIYQIILLTVFFFIFILMWKKGIKRYEGATI